MSDITSICRTAWQQTKKAHQPDYDDLVESYRTMLTARAEGAIASGSVSEDAPFQSFEKAVLEHLPEPVVNIPAYDENTDRVRDPEPVSAEVAQSEEEKAEQITEHVEATEPKPKKSVKKTAAKKAVKKKA